jgi:hypothetical protein
MLLSMQGKGIFFLYLFLYQGKGRYSILVCSVPDPDPLDPYDLLDSETGSAIICVDTYMTKQKR